MHNIYKLAKETGKFEFKAENDSNIFNTIYLCSTIHNRSVTIYIILIFIKNILVNNLLVLMFKMPNP